LTHEEEFGVQARWNYLESGHGKGLCDGLGTSVKRSADNAIKHGKASIQNASDFFCYFILFLDRFIWILGASYAKRYQGC
jgi:hypothetical protein